MLALLHWLLTFFFLAVILTLSLLNTAVVPFDVTPFDPPIALSLSAIVLGAAGVGFLWGMAITWLQGFDLRRENRRLRRELGRSERTRTDLEQAGIREHPETVIAALLPGKKTFWPF